MHTHHYWIKTDTPYISYPYPTKDEPNRICSRLVLSKALEFFKGAYNIHKNVRFYVSLIIKNIFKRMDNKLCPEYVIGEERAEKLALCGYKNWMEMSECGGLLTDTWDVYIHTLLTDFDTDPQKNCNGYFDDDYLISRQEQVARLAWNSIWNFVENYEGLILPVKK